jgi:hypothetical protein
MANDRTTFDIIKNVERRNIEPLARKIIALTIARGCDPDGICQHVGVRDLMRSAQVCERQVGRHLDALVENGHIERHRRGSAVRRQHSRYVVVWHQPDPREDSEPWQDFDTDPVVDTIEAIEVCEESEDLETIDHVLVYERAHQRRSRIVRAAEQAEMSVREGS